MNKRTKILTLLILVTFIPSIYFSSNIKAVVVSNQLELTKDSYVKGRGLFSNSSVTDLLAWRNTITVEDIYNTTDLGLNLVQVKVGYEVENWGELFGLEEELVEFTHLIFEHNRTEILPAARLFVENSTYSVELSVLGYTAVEELLNFNNTKITFYNGTTYTWGDVQPGDFGYSELSMWMFFFLLINYGLLENFKWTLLGISPTANVGDSVKYYNTDSDSDDLGSVVDKPTITTPVGKSFDAIHVQYEYNFVFGFWSPPTLDCYYDAKTGLLIRSIEDDGTEKFEFTPDEIVIKRAGLIPLPISGVIFGIVAIGLITIYKRKRK
jgi:hypothetical protein